MVEKLLYYVFFSFFTTEAITVTTSLDLEKLCVLSKFNTKQEMNITMSIFFKVCHSLKEEGVRKTGERCRELKGREGGSDREQGVMNLTGNERRKTGGRKKGREVDAEEKKGG